MKTLKPATLLATAALLCAVPAGAGAADVAVSTTAVTDGSVNAVAYDSSGRAYVGGSFQFVGPRLGSGVALTTSSDVPAAGFPDINGPVFAATSDGAGGEFIGGSFTHVGGVPRERIAHIRADGTLDPGWNPGAKGTVRALALSASGDSVFVGGDFTGSKSIGGQTRFRLAKLSAATGAVDPAWDPAASSSVRAFAVSSTVLFVGGLFGDIDGVSPSLLAKVAPDGTGAVDPIWGSANNGVRVNALALSGNDLYVGGLFFDIGGQARSGLAKLATATGSADATWDPSPDAEVTALQLSGSDVFVAGQFFSVGGQVRPGVAKLATTGVGDANATWNPNAFGPSVDALALSGGELVVGGSFEGIGGQDRRNLGRLSTTGIGAATAWDPNPNGPVRALATSGSSIFAGGEFSSAGPLNEERGGLIRLNPNGSLDTGWDPSVNGEVNALSLEGTELFIGGAFNFVHGQSRSAIAKLSTAGSGEPDPTWNPGVSGIVRALTRSGGSVFVGGEFSGPNSIGTATRNNIAKVSAGGAGTVDPTWNPDAFGPVLALAVSGNDVFAGGAFSQIGGQPRNRLAKLSAVGNGDAVAAWDPNPSNEVDALVVSGPSLYVGGVFNGTIGGQFRSRLAKLSTAGAGDAEASWAPNPNGIVTSLALSGDDLYVGGSYGSIGGEPRNRLARLAAATGAVDPAFEPAASSNGGPVIALAATPSRVLVGGAFSSIGPLSTANLGVFDLTTPTLSLTSPFEGARYRQGQAIAAAYTCDDPDALADLLTCAGTVPSGSPIDTATPGAKAFTATATDAGARSATSTVNYTVDGSPPEISIFTPAQDAVYSAGTVVPVAFTCTDEDGPADVASCEGTAAAGSRLDVSEDGTHSFTVTSADLVGNTSTKTVTYSVTGNPKAPVVSAPVISAFKIKPAAFTAKRGARVTFGLSTAATVTFKVTRKKGRRTVTVGSFTRKATDGANAFKFRGKVGRKTLKPGRYRMAVRAEDAGGLLSASLAKPFRIKKP